MTRNGTVLDLSAADVSAGNSSAVTRLILPETTGLTHHLTPNGWWACQRSDSDWVFAIGRAADDSEPLYFDGFEAPASSPPSCGWRLADDGNWSGDCYW